jgi:hypothetical protein
MRDREVSFSGVVSKYHEKLSEAMSSHRGQVLTIPGIKRILFTFFPEIEANEDWILPSDHCRNHTNKGACYCSMSDKAIFERVERGKYLVL